MEPNQRPERPNQWSASFHERRTALFIAGVCIVIIGAAIVAPQWFASKGGDSDQQFEPAQTTRSEQAAQPTYRISAPPPVAAVSAETPVERARPEPAPKPQSQPVASQPEPAAATAVSPAPKPVAATASPKPVTAALPQSAVSKAPPGYFVQVGAFKERKLADSLLKKLTANGFNSRLVDRGSGMIGVWIGPENSHQAAEKLREELQKRLKLKGFVTHSG